MEWVTTLSAAQASTELVVRLGQARWDIENYGFNELVNGESFPLRAHQRSKRHLFLRSQDQKPVKNLTVASGTAESAQFLIRPITDAESLHPGRVS